MIQVSSAGESQPITVSGGAVLHTELHHPAPGSSARGSVLVRTPYGLASQRGLAASLSARGFLCWLQDVRGKHGSSGTFDPYRTEAGDGLTTVRHIRGSAAHRGPLLLMGSSYGATCALEAARYCPGAEVDVVVALVPTIGRRETARALDGSLRVRDRFGWWHQHAFTPRTRPPLDDEQLDELTRDADEHGPTQAAHRHHERLGWPQAQLEAWRAMWQERDVALEERFGACRAPLLVISGQQDFFADRAEPLRAAWGSRTAQQDSTLLTGPWGHTLQGRDPDLGARIDRWIDSRINARLDSPDTGHQTPGIRHRAPETAPAR